ncbi:MAG TPA: DUF1349 domain-containing protein [Alphaproteobacteria bacterium]|nr:DUF1349 domain-containing protein [Alphaproteobacteria bacterium]
MKLENLIDFEWLNEPENVNFADKEIRLVANANTDFWQALHHQIKKDNAHFFYKKTEGNFSFVVKWRFENTTPFKQCGIMARIDERNWFKASLLSKDENSPEIGTCLTVQGYSDWAGAMLSDMPNEIFYKLERRGDDFVCYYSLDGQTYIRLRQFYLRGVESEIKIGAYLASPQNESFEAVLDEIDFA